MEHVTALRRARENDAGRRALGGDLEDEAPSKPLGFDVAQAEAFVEAFRGAPVDDEEVAMLRETVYRVLKVEYRHMVETGELPRHSRAALHLERAADVCLDSTELPIHDYKALKRDLGGTRLDKTTDDCFTFLDSCFNRIDLPLFACKRDLAAAFAVALDPRHAEAFSMD